MDTKRRLWSIMWSFTKDQAELVAAYYGRDFSLYCDDLRMCYISAPDGLLPVVGDDGRIMDFAWRDQLEMDPNWRPLNRWLMPLEAEAVVWSDTHVEASVAESIIYRDPRPGEAALLPSVHEWVKLSEAARRLSCSTRTLRRWRAAGKVAETEMRRAPGRQWVFRASAVERLLAGD
jgi:hypothetical protein